MTRNYLLAGGIAGLAATIPMTIWMLAAYRRLTPEEQYPLPPAEITAKIGTETAEAMGAQPPSSETLTAATWAAHFGYGATMGALYGALPRAGHPLARGAAWGITVWAGSYLGWLPAARILRPATKHPGQRNTLMIVAHVVWGTTTGVLAHAIATKRK